MIALRTYARYVLPLTLVSTLAFAPLCVLLGRPGAVTLTGVRTLVKLVWVVAGTAWIVQLTLVGAAAPLVGARLSQLRALRVALSGAVRAALPCAAAAAAVLVGGLALVVPGLLLLVLFALTGASDAPGIQAPLEASARIARRAPWRLAAIVAAVLVVDVLVALVVLRLPHPRPKLPAHLATYRVMLPALFAGLALVTPVFACMLAAFHHRHAEVS